MFKEMLKIYFLLLVVAAASFSIIAQEANLQAISAQMSDGVRIETSVANEGIESGQGLVIKFRIRNESNSDIYLVTDTPTKIHLERSVVELGIPIPSPSGHGRENLSFTKIKIGTAHQGTVLIPNDAFDKKKFNYLIVSMAYVREFDELGVAKSEHELVGILRNNVYMRAETVRLGFLSID